MMSRPKTLRPTPIAGDESNIESARQTLVAANQCSTDEWCGRPRSSLHCYCPAIIRILGDSYHEP